MIDEEPRIVVEIRKESHDRSRVEELESIEVPMSLVEMYADGLDQMGDELRKILYPEE